MEEEKADARQKAEVVFGWCHIVLVLSHHLW